MANQHSELANTVLFGIYSPPDAEDRRRAADAALSELVEQLEALQHQYANGMYDGRPVEYWERLEEQYAELEKAAAVLVAQPFGSLDQRAFYRLREVLGG